MSRVVVSAAMLAALILLPAAGAAGKPKPWFWTVAKAESQVIARNPQEWSSVVGTATQTKIVTSKCRGALKPVVVSGVRRFEAFRCAVTFAPGTPLLYPTEVLWTQVRPKAPGTAMCFSTAGLHAIDRACLGKPSLTAGQGFGNPFECSLGNADSCLLGNSKYATRTQLRRHFANTSLDAEIQCSKTGPSSTRCSWAIYGRDADWRGQSSVKYTKSGARWSTTVTLSNISCSAKQDAPLGTCPG